MQALYQLSYSPGIARVTATRTAVSIPVPWTLSNNLDTDPRRRGPQPAPATAGTSAVVAEHRLRQRPGVVLEQPPAAGAAATRPTRRSWPAARSTPQSSSGRPSSRAAPSRIAAPWLTTTASVPAAGRPRSAPSPIPPGRRRWPTTRPPAAATPRTRPDSGPGSPRRSGLPRLRRGVPAGPCRWSRSARSAGPAAPRWPWPGSGRRR